MALILLEEAALRVGRPWRWPPARVGHGAEARQALDRAIAADPTFAKDPRGAFRPHRAPDDLTDQFMAGPREAGLEILPHRPDARSED